MRKSPIVAVVVPVALALGACGASDPLATPGECSGPVWTTRIDLGPNSWSELGAVAADNGTRVLAVWQAAPLQGDDIVGGDDTMFALLDRETGELLSVPRVLTGTSFILGLQVVVVDGRFRVLTFTQDDVRVHTVDVNGDPVLLSTLDISDGTFQRCVLADDAGVTIIDGVTVTRIDPAGRIVSSTEVTSEPVFCTSVAATTPGRMLGWFLGSDGGAEQWGRPRLIEMATDGSDAVVHDVDDSFPPKDARLVTSGSHVILAQMDEPDVRSALLSFDGAVLAGPTTIGSAPDDGDLVGDQMCGGTCEGLTLTPTTTGALVGFEFHTDSDAWGSGTVRFAGLEADDENLVVSGEGEARAHAHSGTATTSGPLLTWIDTGDFFLPWSRPSQHIVVKRVCSAR
ncbi:MAG: hypothetical protein Q8O67_10960 [Deltaproteobacteria bacterium]|nr:hypothetical protein [Deltaproteobacteria bacterium]